MPDFQLVDQGNGHLHNVVLKNRAKKMGHEELKLDRVREDSLFELMPGDNQVEVVNVLSHAKIFINSRPVSATNMTLKVDDTLCVGSESLGLGLTVEEYQALGSIEWKDIKMYILAEFIPVEGGIISDEEYNSDETEKCLADKLQEAFEELSDGLDDIENEPVSVTDTLLGRPIDILTSDISATTESRPIEDGDAVAPSERVEDLQNESETETVQTDVTTEPTEDAEVVEETERMDDLESEPQNETEIPIPVPIRHAEDSGESDFDPTFECKKEPVVKSNFISGETIVVDSSESSDEPETPPGESRAPSPVGQSFGRIRCDPDNPGIPPNGEASYEATYLYPPTPPSSEHEVPHPVPKKRGRGRPRKIRPLSSDSSSDESLEKKQKRLKKQRKSSGPKRTSVLKAKNPENARVKTPEPEAPKTVRNDLISNVPTTPQRTQPRQIEIIEPQRLNVTNYRGYKNPPIIARPKEKTPSRPPPNQLQMNRQYKKKFNNPKGIRAVSDMREVREKIKEKFQQKKQQTNGDEVKPKGTAKVKTVTLSRFDNLVADIIKPQKPPPPKAPEKRPEPKPGPSWEYQ